MANNMMKVESIRRTGKAADGPQRFIVVTKPAAKEGEQPTEVKLSTPIVKVTAEPVVTGGPNPKPKEQYSFQVGKTIAYRFADATALVLKKHKVDVSGIKAAPDFVKEAKEILEGRKPLRTRNAETIGMPEDSELE